DVSAHPGKQIQVVHSCYWIHVLRLSVDRSGDLFVVPLGASPWNNMLHLLEIERAGVAVVALFHGHGATLEQGRTLHAVGQDSGKLTETLTQWGRNLFKRSKRQWLLIDGVATKELVSTFTGENNLDVFASFRGDEDRKSTRLNSSHVSISYAVFCLKKKK